MADSVLLEKLVANDPLAKVYATTYKTMNQYLNLGDGALQEKARNIQIAIQQAQLNTQAVEDGIADIKEGITDAGKNLLHWAQGGIGFPGKDGDVDPILIPEPPLPIVGHFNVARLLLANAISGGGASARKALIEAYDVEGEGGIITSANWDKAIKMFGIAKKYALTSPELTPLLFGDDFKLTPEQLLSQAAIIAARLGTYFAPTADVEVEMNKISSSILNSDWNMIEGLCTSNTIASSISHMCIPIFTNIQSDRIIEAHKVSEAFKSTWGIPIFISDTGQREYRSTQESPAYKAYQEVDALKSPYVHPGIKVKDVVGIAKDEKSGRSVYPNGEFVCPVGFVVHGKSCKMCEKYPEC